MSKNYNPILIVSGDPKSVFLEIFFKSIKLAKRPLILIVSKKILKQQINILGYKTKLNEILNQNISKTSLDNKAINYIDVPLKNINYTKS